jgi:site-specific DNA-methyltransferase (adenine-specific)
MIKEFENGKLYKGDCLEVMKDIADKSVDMILCDLPYGTTQNKWDSIIDLSLLWGHYNRIIKDNGVILLTASQPFTTLLGASNIKHLKYSWIWKKTNSTGFLNASKQPLKNYEDILVFYKKKPTYNPQGLLPFNKITKRGHNGTSFGKSGTENFQAYTNYPKMVIEFGYDKIKIHPTQKPVSLFEYLILTYTDEHMLVLDNCSGSGTTGIAAINTNRKFILIEQDDSYFELSSKRIVDHIESQKNSLF